MIQFVQETISGSEKRPAITDLINKTTQTLFEGFWGSISSDKFYRLRKETDIISDALLNIDRSKPEPMVSTATKIIMTIQSTFDAFQNSRDFIIHLPKLRSSAPDDGSILIEWIFDDFRINFNIEEDYNESSWHLVSNNLGEISALGFIRSNDIESIIIWLINFVILSYWF